MTTTVQPQLFYDFLTINLIPKSLKKFPFVFLQRRARGLQGGDAAAEEAAGEGQTQEGRGEESGQEEVRSHDNTQNTKDCSTSSDLNFLRHRSRGVLFAVLLLASRYRLLKQ